MPVPSSAFQDQSVLNIIPQEVINANNLFVKFHQDRVNDLAEDVTYIKTVASAFIILVWEDPKIRLMRQNFLNIGILV